MKNLARSKSGRAAVLFAIKAVHSLAFGVIQSCILYLLYSGVRRKSDRRAVLAGSVALVECAIYAGNGFRCPLTDLAEEMGAESGSVTDIFLPDWLARNIANIYTPMLVLGLWLHARNLRSRRAASRAVGSASSAGA